MNELIKVGERTYYISGPFHVGVYDLGTISYAGKREVCLIDTGVDKVVAKVIDKRLIEAGFTVKMIINTHYHADHCGGNLYFKEKYDCIIYATKLNAALIENFQICPAIIWGATPIREVLNNYFYAEPTEAEDISAVNLPEGLEYTELPGHCIGMIAVRTSDDVLFLGDAVVSQYTVENHPLTYIYEVGEYLESLEKLKKIKAALYIPYHAEPVKKIKSLCDINIKSVLDNIQTIKKICEIPRHIDEVISMFFNEKGLKLSMYKYAVEGGIIKTYITHLYNNGELTAENIDSYIKWKTIDDKN
ncbi:MAG: MBL fold metallo-hydrolase [Lachnospiraceae bacterium]|nr:MBL fold metallo-hydrolase [Lachnospiraceae bacterium]